MKKYNKATAKTETPKTDVYQMITDRIVLALENKIIPWRKPWNSDYGMPRNYATGHIYQGINTFLLAMVPAEYPLYLTFKQAQDLGGNVKKGEKGLPIIFYSTFEKEERTEAGDLAKNRIPFIKYSTVFNISQVENINFILPTKNEREHLQHEEAEQIIKRYTTELNGPRLEWGGSEAYYHKALDYVRMPRPETFISPEHYYSVFFHELTHSTGHKNRINRPDLVEAAGFGSPAYAREELTAEMGAAFLSATANIDISNTIENSTSYIQSWLKALKNDKKLIFTAASQAQKATYTILGQEAPTYEKQPFNELETVAA